MSPSRLVWLAIGTVVWMILAGCESETPTETTQNSADSELARVLAAAGVDGLTCLSDSDCGDPELKCVPVSCNALEGGECIQATPVSCPRVWDPVCGCTGQTFPNECFRLNAGAGIASVGVCPKIPCGGLAGLTCPDGQACQIDVGTCDVADGSGVCVPQPDACGTAGPAVCGCDGETYANKCEAFLAGTSISAFGACVGFGCSGSADCGESEFCRKKPGACDDIGQCKPAPSSCPDTGKTVCGCDGETYSNSCFAASAGVSVASGGTCPATGGCSDNNSECGASSSCTPCEAGLACTVDADCLSNSCTDDICDGSLLFTLPECTIPGPSDGGVPNGSSWADSYLAPDGKCYCDSSYDHDVDTLIVSTPAGDRNAKEICIALGSGPGSPVAIFNDVQCGNGPANTAGDEDWCPGITNDGYNGCCTAGPKWDLSVYEPGSATCTDGARNGDETGIDCGGSCGDCGSDGDFCYFDFDCISGNCNENNEQCVGGAASSCSDGIQNGSETGVDCGGECDSCSGGAGVAIPAQIEAEDFDAFFDTTSGNSGNCGSGPVDQQTTSDVGGGCNVGWTVAGEWLEYNIDVVVDGNFDAVLRVASAGGGKNAELSIDGEPVGTVTAEGAGWQSWTSETINNISINAGLHVVRVTFLNGDMNLNWLSFSNAGENCSDGVINQGESDVDCGGANCGPCDAGASCMFDGDCTSGDCGTGICQPGAETCYDYAMNQDETDEDCGGVCSYACFNNLSCETNDDCQSQNCVADVCEGPPGYHSDITRLVPADLNEFNNVPGGWLDSYSHDGVCYCIGGNDHDTDTIFVETPFGSMDVETLCEKFDDARAQGLIPGKQGGDPIYNDVQCGNGPANTASDEQPGTGCPGRVDIANADGCNQAGPTWDLRFMFDLEEYK